MTGPALAVLAELKTMTVLGADGIGEIRLTRHDIRNALGRQTADDFAEGVRVLDRHGTRACVLAAEGTVFSAGADLKASHANAKAPMRLLEAMAGAPFVWVSAVRGGAIGLGAAVALTAPIVVMSEDAWFWLPELGKLGRLPVGVVQSLVPLIGARPAMGLAITQGRVTAVEARAAGWATEVVAADDVEQTALGHARAIAGAAPDSIVALRELWAETCAGTARRS